MRVVALAFSGRRSLAGHPSASAVYKKHAVVSEQIPPPIPPCRIISLEPHGVRPG